MEVMLFLSNFFIPLSYFLSKYEMSKNFRFKSTIIFFLVTAIFIGRNVDRIFYEVDFIKLILNKICFFH